MRLHVVGTGTARGKDLAKYRSDPDFRKATRHMLMAYAALESILEKSPPLEKAAFVLGSSYGELEVTKEFLSTLANQGVARPLLFQSSLHNATLGFLALKLGLRGPSMTVSHRYFTGENALEAAGLLLHSNVRLCLVLGVETRVNDLEPGLVQNYPAKVKLDEGAGALLLASDEAVRELGLSSLAIVEAIDCYPEGDSELSGSYYDSDAIEKIVEVVSSGAPRDLQLSKPGRGFSIVRFSK